MLIIIFVIILLVNSTKKGECSSVDSKHKIIEIYVLAIKTIFERFDANGISYLPHIVYSSFLSRVSILLPEASFTFGSMRALNSWSFNPAKG